MLLSSHINNHLSLHARHSLKEARDIARYTKSSEIESRHLLLALALEEGSLGSLLLENLGFKKESLGKSCLKKPGRRGAKTKAALPLPLSSAAQAIIKRAFYIASEHRYPYVGTEHLMSALLEAQDPFVEAIIDDLGLTPDKVRSTIESHLHFEQFPQMAKMFELTDFPGGDGATGSPTPLLDQYTVDLALEAAKHPVTLVGREAELERLMHILGRKEKRNALLIGDPGVGKTALVTALACRIEAGQAGPLLRGKRIHNLDLALLVAGTSFRGEFETRIKELLKEVVRAGNVVLFIDEMHTLVGTGNTQGGLDAANIFKPALARGDIHVIGATTFAEYKRYLEKDAALDRRFQTIELPEPTPEEAEAILKAAAPHYALHHGVAFKDTLLRDAVTLSVRFIPDRFLPDKALDLIDEAGALVRRRRDKAGAPSSLHLLETKYTKLGQAKEAAIGEGKYEEALALEKRLASLKEKLARERRAELRFDHGENGQAVTTTDLLTVLERITHIPLERLTQAEPEKRLASFTKKLGERFIGQPEVTQSVLRLLTRSLSPIRDPKRPLGSLLLLGPTGVGKTYLARLLAEEFFGDERALIRLDMSEFMERHSVAQMLGAPAGYVGYGEGGKLTEALKRRPSSVVLFDEIEKAHPDVANLLLQILDEGHLTDAEGRRVSFKHTLILLTSNIGTASFTQAARIGFSERGVIGQREQFEAIKTTVLTELRDTLRPELLSRLDEVLVFNPLDRPALETIARLELQTLGNRLAEHGIRLHFRSDILKRIASEAGKRGDGARYIKKQIAEEIEYQIAAELLVAPRPKSLTLSLNRDAVSVRR